MLAEILEILPMRLGRRSIAVLLGQMMAIVVGGVNDASGQLVRLSASWYERRWLKAEFSRQDRAIEPQAGRAPRGHPARCVR